MAKPRYKYTLLRFDQLEPRTAVTEFARPTDAPRFLDSAQVGARGRRLHVTRADGHRRWAIDLDDWIDTTFDQQQGYPERFDFELDDANAYFQLQPLGLFEWLRYVFSSDDGTTPPGLP